MTDERKWKGQSVRKRKTWEKGGETYCQINKGGGEMFVVLKRC